ncbi:coatomer subunit beta [Elasticomyces elasticus]|nr:coatomer subunit beta [Elasticomyces elasticus]KAK3621791.1 coatomer subunit beta [Elasticomyces elasticus]KAK4906626.1 coatomer subunit beta [Elasticomyces elasticus]
MRLHRSAIRHPDIAERVIGLLVDAISDFNSASVVDVISFVKTVVEKIPKMRSGIVRRLSTEERDIQEAWKATRDSLGETLIVASETRALEREADGETQDATPAQTNGHGAKTGHKQVLAGGIYGIESALTTTATAKTSKAEGERPPLRQLTLDGDFFLATVLSFTVTRLVVRHREILDDAERTTALRVEATLIMISIVRVGQSSFLKAAIDDDIEGALLEDTRRAFRHVVQVEEKKRREEDVQKAEKAVQVDDVLSLHQLAKEDGASVEGGEVEDLELGTQGSGTKGEGSLGSKLKRVVQFAGFSDPVYAEAYVQVHQFDIILDFLLLNQTPNTLQNLSVEFATLGDLRMVETPLTQDLGGMDVLNIKATIKVSSTDTGVIFGNMVYDGASSLDSQVAILNDVHVDIMDYIVPPSRSEAALRTMLTEFGWKNRVNISTKMVVGAEGGTGPEGVLEAAGDGHEYAVFDSGGGFGRGVQVLVGEPVRPKCVC